MAFQPPQNILVNDMKSIFNHFLQHQATYGPEDTFKFKSIKFKGKGIPANYNINPDVENSSENNYEVGHPQKDHSICNPIPILARDSEPAPVAAPVSVSIPASAPACNQSAFVPSFNPTPISNVVSSGIHTTNNTKNLRPRPRPTTKKRN